jgi:chemotaxis protein MotB
VIPVSRSRGSRKRKAAGHPNHERWLLSYADFITLVLIFFIIMYAMSKVDLQKYEVLAKALKQEFSSSDSILPGHQGLIDSMPPQEEPQPKEEEQTQQEKKNQELADLLQKVQLYIDQNNLQAQVAAENTPRGVSVTLNDLFLFDLGKADLKQGAYPVLNQLASLFPTLTDATISIEGHTDDLPLSTGSPFRDNWGLSQARSLSVLRYFVYDNGLNSKQFISTSFADTRPVVENSTAENRAKNRRVEIVVLR